jgi:hypothetical protein
LNKIETVFLPSFLPGDLVSKLLARDDGDLLAYSLVGVEVQSETSVVLLDEGLRGLLDSLGSNASLDMASGKNEKCWISRSIKSDID